MGTRWALAVLALAALLANGFFLWLSLSNTPVRPRPPAPRRVLLADFEPEQARWFQRNVLDEFNAERGANVHLHAVPEEELLARLRGTQGAGEPVFLAVLPAALAQDAWSARALRPFDTVASSAALDAELSVLEPGVVADARTQSRRVVLPRQVSLDVAVYRLSKVRDAMLHWTELRPEIEEALRAANGRGLPVGYALERTPASWDSFDLFVAGYYWSHHADGGAALRGRLAHRTGTSFDGTLDIVAGILRAGGREDSLGNVESQPSLDYFAWETLLRAQGVYAPEMFASEGFEDDDMQDALRSGQLYLGFADEAQAFSLHGGSHRDSPTSQVDSDDLGFFPVPTHASLELDASGQPARRAPRFTFRELDVWALPASGPDAELAWDLVRWTYDHDTQLRECEALGLNPLRKDLSREAAAVFRVEWMNDVFAASLTSWPSSRLVPQALLDNGLGTTYAVAWENVVRGSLPPGDREALLAALHALPPPVRAAQPVRRLTARRDAPRSAPLATALSRTRLRPAAGASASATDAGAQRDASEAAALEGGAR